MRPHPLLMATVTAALLLGGCSDDDKSEPTGKTSASASARPSDAPAPPYAATLVAGDQGKATLTNTGAKNDRYVMQVVPSVLGAAIPPVVELKPGASAEVTYQLTSQEMGDTVPTLVAHSTTTGEDVTLELSD